MPVEEAFGDHGGADRQPQEEGGDVDDLVLCRFVQPVDHAAFLEQVAQHQGGDERGGIRGDQADDDGHHQGEDDHGCR